MDDAAIVLDASTPLSVVGAPGDGLGRPGSAVVAVAGSAASVENGTVVDRGSAVAVVVASFGGSLDDGASLRAPPVVGVGWSRFRTLGVAVAGAPVGGLAVAGGVVVAVVVDVVVADRVVVGVVVVGVGIDVVVDGVVVDGVVVGGVVVEPTRSERGGVVEVDVGDSFARVAGTSRVTLVTVLSRDGPSVRTAAGALDGGSNPDADGRRAGAVDVAVVVATVG